MQLGYQSAQRVTSLLPNSLLTRGGSQPIRRPSLVHDRPRAQGGRAGGLARWGKLSTFGGTTMTFRAMRRRPGMAARLRLGLAVILASLAGCQNPQTRLQGAEEPEH